MSNWDDVVESMELADFEGKMRGISYRFLSLLVWAVLHAIRACSCEK